MVTQNEFFGRKHNEMSHFLTCSECASSCDIMQVDNYGWNMNGTFNGVMGLFQQKKIQILSHATIMREDRLKHVEFTGEVFVIE